MGKIWNAIRNWLDETRMGVNLLAIEGQYRRDGHENPTIAARNEVFLRAEYLERFRDEASAAYLRGTPLAECKTKFIKQHLMAKVSILDSLTTARVRDIIRSMSESEAYHGAALQKWNEEFAAWREEMRTANKKLNGTSGMSDLTKRVLRASV